MTNKQQELSYAIQKIFGWEVTQEQIDKLLNLFTMQMSYNVENTVTGVLINVGGVPVEYDTEAEAMTAAMYYAGQTGENHVVVGPHPKPKP